jgi:deoxyadenosine/deoxycytidine kinase
MSKPFLVIAGNIGAGKSTVAERLSDELGLAFEPEPAQSNPYLDLFYASRSKWAFNSQLYFLVAGLRKHREIASRSGGTVQDRSLYEHYMVFARQLHEDGDISEDDFAVLSDLYYGVQDLLPAPDLLVMLKVNPATSLLRVKGRPNSQHDLSLPYLSRLDDRYQQFLDGWIGSPVLQVDTEKIDPRTAAGLAELSELVSDQLS